MVKKYIGIVFFNCLFCAPVFAQQTGIRYLSGIDKDHTVTWDFYCTKGQNSGKWSTIRVPSCWELQGFGTYDFGYNRKSAAADETGLYRYHFKADKEWKGKQVNIVFEGSLTDTKVKINGKIAGETHRGGYYRFKYNITPLLKFGTTNLLEVRVDKQSANKSVNRAERDGDFWAFGGIYRPVYLEILPEVHIERVAIDAKADGRFTMHVFTSHAVKDYTLEAAIRPVDNDRFLKPLSAMVSAPDTLVMLQHQYKGVELWSPEFPNLYIARVSLKDQQGNTVHTIEQKFGFRTAELRPHDGFYLNGKKILFKGVNRHSIWPESGRTSGKALDIGDVRLMKEMNMNAVRASHYPPDKTFLEACDSMGLMVVDELTGWQANYDDITGHRLVKEMVTRDVNHPSIVIWANGNEGGFNRNLDQDFHVYDPQKRLVIHPWEKFNGANTKHYPDYNYLVNTFLYGHDVYFPTEFLHGIYDGGAGAGLDDFWNLMVKSPLSAGGFLWVFADGGIIRTDKNDSLDTHGNDAPDGILGPYREKEGSFYTIKAIWSPVYIDRKYLTPGFDGKLNVENRYAFTNLDQCTFRWRLSSFNYSSGKTVQMVTDATGRAEKISIRPGEKKLMDLQLPPSWLSSDVLYLTALDPHGKEIFTWSWPVSGPAEWSGKWLQHVPAPPISAEETDSTLVVRDGDVQLFFSKTNGYLEKVMRNDSLLSLSDGPALAGLNPKLELLTYAAEDEKYVINALYKEESNWLKVKWTFTPGMPAELAYSYSRKGESDFMGITFNYPEQEITGMQWIGRGPSHVWKNRLKGLKFGFWEKAYNNTVTGESWQYPEFKGNHEDTYWVRVKTRQIPFTIFTGNRRLFFQMLKPSKAKEAYNNNSTPNYPEGNIGFMSAIQPVGTKFHTADKLGPQGGKNVQLNAPYEGVLWFDFR